MNCNLSLLSRSCVWFFRWYSNFLRSRARRVSAVPTTAKATTPAPSTCRTALRTRQQRLRKFLAEQANENIKHVCICWKVTAHKVECFRTNNAACVYVYSRRLLSRLAVRPKSFEFAAAQAALALDGDDETSMKRTQNQKVWYVMFHSPAALARL